MCTQGSCLVCTPSQSGHTARNNLRDRDFSVSSQFMSRVHHPQGPVILTEVRSKACGNMLFHCFAIRIEAGHSGSAQLFCLRVSKLQQPSKRKVSVSRHA